MVVVLLIYQQKILNVNKYALNNAMPNKVLQPMGGLYSNPHVFNG